MDTTALSLPFQRRLSLTKVLFILLPLVIIGNVYLAYWPHTSYTYPLLGDEYVHISIATSLTEDDGSLFRNPYFAPERPHVNFESGFHIFLSAIFAFTDTDPVFFYKDFVIVFMVLNSLLLFYLVYLWTEGPYAALFATFFYGTIKSTSGLIAHHYFLPLTLGITLLLTAFIALHHVTQRRTAPALLLLLGSMFAMAFTYPPALFFFIGTTMLYLLSLDHNLHTGLSLTREKFFGYVSGLFLVGMGILLLFLYHFSLLDNIVFYTSWDVVHNRLSPIFHFGTLASALAGIGALHLMRSDRNPTRIPLYWALFSITSIYLFYTFGFSFFIPFPRLFLFFLIGMSILAGIGVTALVRYLTRVMAKGGKVVAIILLLLTVGIQYDYTLRDAVRHHPILTNPMYRALTFLGQINSMPGIVIADGITSLGVYPASRQHVVGLLDSNVGGGDPKEARAFLTGSCEQKKVSLYRLREEISEDPLDIPVVTMLSNTPQECTFLEMIYNQGPYLYQISHELVAEAILPNSRIARALIPTPSQKLTLPDTPVLDGAALNALVAGNTLRGPDWVEYYNPNGELTGTKSGLRYQGHWEIRDNSYCLYYPGTDRGMCFTVSKNGTILTLYQEDGQIYASDIVWEEGNPEHL